MNKNLGALISWREGGTPRIRTLDFLESNFLTVRQTKQYCLFSKIIKRARYLRKGLIRRVRAECLYMNANGVICVAAIKKARYAPLKRKIDGLSAVIKEYRRKRLDLLKGKDPYAMPERVVINFKAIVVKSHDIPLTKPFEILYLTRKVIPELPFYWIICGLKIEKIQSVLTTDRFDYFSHPKGFYVREKPILTPDGLILQPVFELLNRHGKDNNGNTRKN